MSRLNLSHIYNPANQSPDELIANFVIRTKEFKKINDALNDTKLNQSPQHFLIEGQRGTGKTSLLLRLQYAMVDKDAPGYLLPVQLPEEQYNIFNLCRLWESVAEYLDEIPGFENTSELLEEHREEHDYESICYDLIDTLLIKNKKRLVLLLDNFGEMLKRIGETDQKRLRDILHMSKHIQIVAASAKTLEQTYKYESPFFEFFKIIRLKGLDQSDSIALLEKLAATYKSEETIQRIIKDEPQRIETIRRLSGGIPRTIILLFEILLDDTAQVFDDLESILDKVTPLYKHRMDDLPKQQQIIMDAIALNWDGISNREIANALKSRSMDGKKIAAQLRELEKSDLVKSRPVDKKNKIYFIAERFFNIWYLMRFGRKKNKEHVRWLVLFLQEWCSPDELKNRALSHIENLKNHSLHPRGGYLMAEAIALALPDAELGQRLLKSTKDYIGRVEGPPEQDFSDSKHAVKDKTELSNDDLKLSNQIVELKRAVEQGEVDAMVYLGWLYQTEYKDFERAIEYYQMAIEKDNADAMSNLASLYVIEYKDFERAIEYYQMAVEKRHASAMFNLALLYDTEYKDFERAIEYYQMAVEKDDAEAMVNLAFLYQTECKDFDRAIEYYQMAVEKGHAVAMSSLALFYYGTAKEKDLALKLSKEAVEADASGEALYVYAIVALWHQDFEACNKAIIDCLSNHDYSKYIRNIANYFILLLAMDQNHTAFNLFNVFENLKGEIKPVYFATMKLLRDEYPKEYLKMGEELESTVNEILKKVDEYRAKYAN